jgi:hypothetical protein
MAVTTVAGWVVETVPGGGGDVGRVQWHQTSGHSYVNQSGQAALFTQIAAYVAGRSSVTAGTAQFWNGTEGWFHVLNGDQASQAASIAVILGTGSYLTGSTTV